MVGLARLAGEFTPDEMASTATLYTYIDQQRLEIRNIDINAKTKRRNARHATTKHKRMLGRSIDERSVAANTLHEFGHFEIDTVVGKRNGHESVVLTLIERQTRMAIFTHRQS